MAEPVSSDREPPKALFPLAAQVEADGGRVLATYRDPIGGKWHLFVLLPLEKVQATPFQRDISKAHEKRLVDVMTRMERFIDPVVVVTPRPGVYWTPNGNHRRAALEEIGAKYLPAILIPELDVAYQILAMNTEKAHNLKEKSLEVARMYRVLFEQDDSRRENEFTFELEQPHFVTLGFVYTDRPSFPGGAFAPILRRVDKFLRSSLRRAYPEREGRARLVLAAEAVLSEKVKAIRERGVRHPYLNQYLIARSSPLSRARKSLPDFEEAMEKLRVNLSRINPGRVRLDQLAGAAAWNAGDES